MKSEKIEYWIQRFHWIRETWADRDGFDAAENAKPDLDALKKQYPQQRYRLIKRTIIDEVIE